MVGPLFSARTEIAVGGPWMIPSFLPPQCPDHSQHSISISSHSPRRPECDGLLQRLPTLVRVAESDAVAGRVFYPETHALDVRRISQVAHRRHVVSAAGKVEGQLAAILAGMQGILAPFERTVRAGNSLPL